MSSECGAERDCIDGKRRPSIGHCCERTLPAPGYRRTGVHAYPRAAEWRAETQTGTAATRLLAHARSFPLALYLRSFLLVLTELLFVKILNSNLSTVHIYVINPFQAAELYIVSPKNRPTQRSVYI